MLEPNRLEAGKLMLEPFSSSAPSAIMRLRAR